jgi:hypothetical protein
MDPYPFPPDASMRVYAACSVKRATPLRNPIATWFSSSIARRDCRSESTSALISLNVVLDSGGELVDACRARVRDRGHQRQDDREAHTIRQRIVQFVIESGPARTPGQRSPARSLNQIQLKTGVHH